MKKKMKINKLNRAWHWVLWIAVLLTALMGCVARESAAPAGILLLPSQNGHYLVADTRFDLAQIHLSERVSQEDVLPEGNLMWILTTDGEGSVLAIAKTEGGFAPGERLMELQAKFPSIRITKITLVREEDLEEKSGDRAACKLPRLLGDINQDGRVDLIDFGLFRKAFGTRQGEPGYTVEADIYPAKNHFDGDWKEIWDCATPDGVIDIFDFAIFRRNFGQLRPADDPHDTRYFAILYGASDYSPAGWSNLPLTANDAEDIAYALSKAFPSYTILHKHTGVVGEDEILYGIQTASRQLRDHDVLLFHYSGHGGRRDTDSFLALSDGKLFWVADLREELDTVPGKTIVIVDACNSGAFVNLMPSIDSQASREEIQQEQKAFNTSLVTAFVPDPQAEVDPRTQKYYVLTSASIYQSAWEASLLQNGVFSFFLADGIGDVGIDNPLGAFDYSYDADANGDGVVTLQEIHDYVAPRARNFLVNLGVTPQDAQVAPARSNFPIVRYAGGPQPQRHWLTLINNPTDGGSVEGAGSYSPGEVIAISATPNEGYQFVNWTKGEEVISTQASHSYIMPAENVTLVANFQKGADPVNPGEMVRVNRGTFQMGDEVGDLQVWSRPVHNVTLTYDYWIGKYEVTFAEYDAFCDETERDKPSDLGHGRGNRPVIHVSWWDAIAYCNWLSDQNGLVRAYDSDGNLLDRNGDITRDITQVEGYRLPTEAEWEYAASGGHEVLQIPPRFMYAGSDNIDEVAWYRENSNRTQPVGGKDPNELGLHDMTGNVWEWCHDWYGSYTTTDKIDPIGPSTSNHRVRRGGSRISSAQGSRVAERSITPPDQQNSDLGFRITKTIIHDQDTYLLTLEPNPTEAGSVEGAGSYSPGEVISILATAYQGYQFVNWTRNGTIVSTQASHSYTMPAENVTLVASFQAEAPTDIEVEIEIIDISPFHFGAIITHERAPVSGLEAEDFILSEFGLDFIDEYEGVYTFFAEGERYCPEWDMEVRMPAGDYTLTFRKSGYVEQTVPFTVPGPDHEDPIDNPPGMVPVERGVFQMGDEVGDLSNFTRPVHTVTLTYDFWIGEKPVTFDEYDAFCDATGRELPLAEGFGRDDRPVINVSWWDAIAYCNWVSQLEGLPLAYDDQGQLLDDEGRVTEDITKVLGYRIPTESEWEYAARGGHLGSNPSFLYSGSNQINDVAWYWMNSNVDGWNSTQPVGLKTPNELLLYDMSGNVSEWCYDWWDLYRLAQTIDSIGPGEGETRVTRGGSWFSPDTSCRVASRLSSLPDAQSATIGFRIARTQIRQERP